MQVRRAKTHERGVKVNESYKFLLPQLANVPESLKQLPWAVWVAEPREGRPGKFNKAPRSPITGGKIGANKPELFGTFEEAKTAYERGKYTGVGVLLINNGIVGVDIDDYHQTVADKPGVATWLREALDIGVYCEKSPSSTGLRLFYCDPNCVQGRKGVGLEIYSNLRFLTFTGNSIKSLEDLA